jgi:uncharacterized protein YgiM (DUF1202 family)
MRRRIAFLLAATLLAPSLALAQALPPGSPGATPPVDRLAPRMMIVTGSVTVHSEATTSSPAIGTLKAGERVEVLNGNGESGWYHLAQGGFAIMDYLSPAEPGTGSSAAAK